jgi:hypothetical protein
MKLEVGTLLRVQTKTKEDVFGDCLYRVEAVGVEMKNPGNPKETIPDGVKCVMLGGSGPAARKGYTVMDSEASIMSNISVGVTEVVTDAQRADIVSFYEDKAKDGTPRKIEHGGAGVVDFD